MSDQASWPHRVRVTEMEGVVMGGWQAAISRRLSGSCQLSAASCKLQVASCQRSRASFKCASGQMRISRPHEAAKWQLTIDIWQLTRDGRRKTEDERRERWVRCAVRRGGASGYHGCGLKSCNLWCCTEMQRVVALLSVDMHCTHAHTATHMLSLTDSGGQKYAPKALIEPTSSENLPGKLWGEAYQNVAQFH